MPVLIENKPFVVGEFGRELRIGTNIELTGRQLEIQFLPPVQNNEIVTVNQATNNVELGTVDYTDPETGQKVFANKYVFWKTEDIFSKSGDWKIRIRVINATVGNESRLISLWEDFPVEL